MLKQIPNVITLSRVLVLAVLVWLVTEPGQGRATWAFWCFVYGALSDWLDGWLARRFGWITSFGKVMDATIDKVLVLGGLALMLSTGFVGWPPIPDAVWWAALILMSVREVGITYLRAVAARRGLIIAADKSGKQKTVAQLLSLTALFGALALARDTVVAPVVVEVLVAAGLGLFVVSVWLSLASGWLYLRKFRGLWAGV